MNDDAQDLRREGTHDFAAIAAQHQLRMVAEVVHLPDNRQPVPDTTRYPASAVAQLIITAADGEIGYATGCFIRPHVLLTAAHAIYVPSGSAKGRVQSMRVIPGRDVEKQPFGESITSTFYAPAAWVDTQRPEFDYGLVFVNPFNVGTFDPVVVSDQRMMNLSVLVSGYPVDRMAGKQLYDKSVISGITPTQVSYDIDTERGDSGANVFHFENGRAFSVAVHRFGDPTANFGTRITQAVLNDIMMHV
jgi:V8-like Glu-specific endopeptidase